MTRIGQTIRDKRVLASPSLQTALRNAVLKRWGFVMPSDLAAPMKQAATFNRRMRKTARAVVWEGAGAQSPASDPIQWFMGRIADLR